MIHGFFWSFDLGCIKINFYPKKTLKIISYQLLFLFDNPNQGKVHWVKFKNFLSWLQNEQNIAKSFKSKLCHFMFIMKAWYFLNATSVNGVILLSSLLHLCPSTCILYSIEKISYTTTFFFLALIWKETLHYVFCYGTNETMPL